MRKFIVWYRDNDEKDYIEVENDIKDFNESLRKAFHSVPWSFAIIYKGKEYKRMNYGKLHLPTL